MLKILITRTSLIGSLLIGIAWAHPFHVSITTFKLNMKSNSVEVTMKIFANDLEKAIRTPSHPDIRIGSKNITKNLDSLIIQYLHKHVQVSIDEKERKLEWIGKELENEIIWCYLEIKNVKNFANIWVQNSIFLLEFDDQLNISHFQKENQIETIMNHKDKRSGSLSFK